MIDKQPEKHCTPVHNAYGGGELNVGQEEAAVHDKQVSYLHVALL